MRLGFQCARFLFYGLSRFFQSGRLQVLRIRRFRSGLDYTSLCLLRSYQRACLLFLNYWKEKKKGKEKKVKKPCKVCGHLKKDHALNRAPKYTECKIENCAYPTHSYL